MGMLTSGRIEITAPAADVFDWLIDPVKLTAWLGGSGGMPENAEELHVGWSSTSDTPAGSVMVEITAYDPPWHLAYRSTYEGGDSISTYRLTEVGGKTTLALEGDTDWGRPKGGLEAQVDQALAGQPEAMRQMAEAQIEDLEQRLDGGAFDSVGQKTLQQAVDAQLEKLKTLVETAKV